MHEAFCNSLFKRDLHPAWPLRRVTERRKEDLLLFCVEQLMGVDGAYCYADAAAIAFTRINHRFFVARGILRQRDGSQSAFFHAKPAGLAGGFLILIRNRLKRSGEKA